MSPKKPPFFKVVRDLKNRLNKEQSMGKKPKKGEITPKQVPTLF